ncbi:MAG TPA: transporter substrate-binding domain-containing protein [Methylomirabilota bacterium]|nr:transporter substrate-binding domain-containing protein [Methylomirabilota bacterium]
MAGPTSSASSPPVPPAAKTELTPTGALRVGINYGNVLLATKDPATGEFRGVAPDLARELARRLGTPIGWVGYDSAGKMAEAVKVGGWDIAFLGAEPARAGEIAFSPAYLEIEATYLVPAGSPIRSVAEVDREGIRIAVADKAAYELYLTRTLQRAKLVRAPSLAASYELFVNEKLDALAGLKTFLLAEAPKIPGSRVLEGRFTGVQQAIATPRPREAAAQYLREYVASVKASGLVAQAIERHRVRGVSVAP